MQFCSTIGLLSTRSKVIKKELVKKSNNIIEIMAMKSDKNQLELDKGIGLRPKMYIFIEVLYENYLICIFLNINENLEMRTKPLEKSSTTWGYIPSLNP